MLKALEILKNNGTYLATDTDTEVVMFYKRQIEEAIKELQELESRSCSNCKFDKGFAFTCSANIRRPTKYEGMVEIVNNKNFNCSIWKTKQ